MNYINDTTKEQLSYYELQQDNLDKSLAEDRTEIIMDVWWLIHTADKPIYDVYTQKVVEVEPVFTTIYTQSWDVVLLTQQELDDNLLDAKHDKSVEIVTTQKDMAITFWSSDSTVYTMTKQKIDTNTRVSELQALTVPTQDETDELVEYGTYFDVNKLTNSERYTFLSDVDAMTTIVEVDAYIYVYSAYPNVNVISDENLTNAQFFIRYGFTRII